MQNETIYNDIIRLVERENVSLVTSDKILLALCSIKDSMTNLIFLELGITVNDVKQAINKSMYVEEWDEVSKYSKQFIKIINNVQSLNDEKEYVYDEAYLYSIINVQDTKAQDVLRILGIDENTIMNELEHALEYLEKDSQMLINLTKLAKERKLNPFIGRFNYIDKLDRILSKKQKNNPMLIGEAGVGKTGIVEGLVEYYLAVNPEVSIFRLDLGFLVAGTRYRGDLEEKIIDAIDEIKNSNSIVFIDEIHNILNGNFNETSLDIANILKPYLARSEIKCIGATTTDEYYKTIARDKALARRFQNVFVEEVSFDECLMILEGIKGIYEDFYDIKYSKDILKLIIHDSKLLTDRKLPDKAIDILDESGLICQRKGLTEVTCEIVKNLSFEYLNLNREHIFSALQEELNYNQLKKYYYNFINGEERKTVLNVSTNNKKLLLSDLKFVFNIKDDAILEIDLNDYLDIHYLSNLLGAPSGYVGYDNGGILTEHILKQPFSVIIFNEYQKASHNFKSIIKKALQKGYINDSKGRKISLHNSIFIFDEIIHKNSLGFLCNIEDQQPEDYLDETI